MLKYLEHDITFREVPDEITLCINITGCPCHCPDCHSKQLWEDVGTELNLHSLHELIDTCKDGISCIAFMGGDQSPKDINYLALLTRLNFPNIRIAWYSGKTTIPKEIDISRFDYIKLGPYVKELGPLDSPTTNQKFYRVFNGELRDITASFWKNKHNV